MQSTNVIVAEQPPIEQDAYGVLRVGGTRVTVDTVIGAYRQGRRPEGIQRSYPTLTLADVYATIACYLRHREQVEQYLQDREQAAEEMQREAERRNPRDGLHERLLARRNGAD